MDWLHDITINTLRKLYSDCAPVRGRKLYRDPLFLANWDTVSQLKKEK
jgi:hypothetical protein